MKERKYCCLQKISYANDEFNLQSIDETHIQEIRNWRNNQMSVLRQNKLISEEEQTAYFNTHVFPEQSNPFPKQVLFNYFNRDRFIGYGGIVHISHEDKIGEISFLMDPVINNAHFYIQAFTNFLQLIDPIAFNELLLEKLFTETYDTRIENVAILENAGYTREGILHSHKVIDGMRSDIYLHGRLKK
jgi:RimJ/RimL family protein N-acetyltransferase